MADPDGTPDDRDAQERVQFHLGRRRDDGLTKCWGLLDDVTAEALRTAFGAMCSPSAERNRTAPPETPETPGGAGPESDTAARTAVTWPANPVATRRAKPARTRGPRIWPTAPNRRNRPASGDDGGRRRAGRRRPGRRRCGRAADRTRRPSDDADAAPTSDAGAAERGPEPCPGPDLGCDLGSNGGGVDHPGPGPVWRPPRLPYEWAPLGSVPTDYPPPPHTAQTRRRPTGGTPQRQQPTKPPAADRRRRRHTRPRLPPRHRRRPRCGCDSGAGAAAGPQVRRDAAGARFGRHRHPVPQPRCRAQPGR